MRTTRFVALASAALVAVACADSPTGTGMVTGTVSAAVTDDASAASVQDAGSTTGAQTAGSTFSGTFTANAQAAISVDGVTWIDLGSPAAIDVALQSTGNRTDIHGNVAVPVGTYTRVRLTLSGAQAQLNAGAVLGGITLTSSATIRVAGGNQFVIEKQVQPFTVSANTHARVIFDLNSQEWVDEESARDEEVDEEDVQESTTAHREVEPRH
jgi:hypothetical protein